MSGAPPIPAHWDRALPFRIEALDLRGRVVAIDPLMNEILQRHHYPGAVSELLCQLLIATALLGSAMQNQGRLTVQTRSDGDVSMMVADYTHPGKLRAMASFDKARSEGHALGAGTLCITMDLGPGAGQRYQGYVELTESGLEDAVRRYFHQSEQLPSFVKIAIGSLQEADRPERRVGAGIIAQFLPTSPERMRKQLGEEEAIARRLVGELCHDEAWIEALARLHTMRDEELLDPALSPEALLLRLFNQHDIHVQDELLLFDTCRCSAERIEEALSGFSVDEIAQCTTPTGLVEVDCEFCHAKYTFSSNYLSANASE